MIEIGAPILKFEPLIEGILLKRYKRFLADVELDDGKIVTAHCANTGPMRGVLFPGGKVRLRYAPSPKRKLDWSWEQAKIPSSAQKKDIWVGVNTSLPNKLIRLAIEANCLKDHLGDITYIRGEVPYGVNGNSRIDLLLKPAINNKDNREVYIEVKNTTWKEGDLALFPDTVTERGQKHLRELISVMPESKSILIPCISRDDVDRFAPGDIADKTYGELFRLALSKGVEVIPCAFGFHSDYVSWEGIKELNRSQNQS